jgi:hypothetical protein
MKIRYLMLCAMLVAAGIAQPIESRAAGRCSTGEYNSCVACCTSATCKAQCQGYLKPKKTVVKGPNGCVPAGQMSREERARTNTPRC